MFYTIAMLLSGFLIVAAVSFDVFQAVIVPRLTSKRLRLGPFLVGQIGWPIYRSFAAMVPDQWQEEFLAFFAPIAFVFLLLVWFSLLILGYSVMLLALGPYMHPPLTDLSQASYFAGSSVLTLGYGDVVASHWTTRLMVLSAAALGITFLGLQVSYLFVMQTNLQQREQVVTTLTSRSGSPASGLVILLRYKELNIVSSLSGSFVLWENWVAGIWESHGAYPMLLYFRSSSRTNSWVSSVGALCDAATLLSTTIQHDSIGEAELFYWLSIKMLKRLCEYLEIAPIDGPHMTKLEFEDGVGLLKDSGYVVKELELSWQRFAHRRSGYMRYLVPLSQAFHVPVHIWIQEMRV